MYLEHFGLKEKPFNITPNPQFIFLSKNHKEVFAHLLYGLQSRCGFIEITGEVGAGKTTVLRTLFEQLEDEEFRLAFIFNPSLSADELLLEICRELNIKTGRNKGAQLLPLINNFLLEENTAGRTVVLVIDEAQNLAAPVLEQIRVLSNLETETDKLIQIILVGQPELADLLGKTNLRQLNQRISVRYHLQPMDEADSISYIQHRLKIAGVVDRDVFTDAAIKLIFKHSTGLPRLINILADRSLLAAFSEDNDIVERQDVKTAIAELQHVSRNTKGYLSPNTLLLASLVVIAGAALFFSLLGFLRGDDPVMIRVDQNVSEQNSPSMVEKVSIPHETVHILREKLAAISEAESFTQAATALSSRWHAEFLEDLGAQFSSRDFIDTLELNGWQWTAYNGDFAKLMTFDTPVLLEFVLPGVPGRRYLAMTGLDSTHVSVYPPIAGQSLLSRNEIEALYSGKAYFVWKNYLDISYYSSIGTSASDVREIQSMLKEAGSNDLELSGVYDYRTIEAVTRFQAEKGIAQDGRVGPLTLLLLYQQSGYFNPPKLNEARPS